MEMIAKPEGIAANDFEIAIANEIVEIAKKTKDLAEPLKAFKMTAAKEVQIEGDKKAIVIFVPYKLFKSFRMIQSRLTTELEKKFEGRPVVFIAQRTILGKTYGRSHKFNGFRPHSHTITAVHEAILDDLIYPCDVNDDQQVVAQQELLKINILPEVLFPNSINSFGSWP